MSQQVSVKNKSKSRNKSAASHISSAKKSPNCTRYGGGIVKARTFYNSKKKKIQEEEEEGTHKNPIVKAKKRTLANFYQRQTHANVSYYTTRNSIRSHLGYVLKKYNPEKLMLHWGKLNRLVQPR